MKNRMHHVAKCVDKCQCDVTTQIAKRAYELYEQRGRRGSLALQDWLQAEREILPKHADGSICQEQPVGCATTN